LESNPEKRGWGTDEKKKKTPGFLEIGRRLFDLERLREMSKKIHEKILARRNQRGLPLAKAFGIRTNPQKRRINISP